MYNNISMTWKVLILLLAFGMVSLGGAFYASQKMNDIDTTYSFLLNGPARAMQETSRAARFLSEAMAAIYKNISADTAEDKALARRNTADAQREFGERISLAATLYPEHGDELKALVTEYRALFDGPCADAMRLANDSSAADNDARAMTVMLKTCEPAARAFLPKLTAVNTNLAKAAHELSDQLSATTRWTSMSTLGAIGFATLALIGIAVVLVRRSIVAPLQGMMGTMQGLGAGQLDTPVADTHRKDEIGAMANALEILRGQLAEAEGARRARAAAAEVERTRLAQRNALGTAFVSRMTELASSFASSSSQVADSARNLSVTAEQTSRQAQAVTEAAEEAAVNVQTVAASSEELAASVREITSQVSHSAGVADIAYSEAQSSNTRIGSLATAASAIGDVVALIKGIADQTNLLALNATIESARAGEAGKGFAVVASEVKQLAAQTAKATDEIASKIAEIQTATNGTVTSMGEIIRVISDMKQISSSIAGAVEQQGAATGEIAHNCQRAATGTQLVTQSIGGVGEAAQLTGSASSQLLALSQDLSSQALDLRSVVEGFVQDLEAA
ncbi:methyl-accepting chemotaxis protein [Azorhizobium oxalatiphilum]|uniref:Methyl-accepting chemotaxis protein n=1 Tax=Azorhizobium oxalatiphilum TaxID=980631 RepID=A0A917C3P2_9HYPH|nr:HAMP domain-containing methyl-accepting chemotaxis protein [Azorhizobium oxalatiphilum]GGF69264.1 methyl-accepting chemotaxis protein [Azorhizobium oxalatiphilum]